MNERITEKSIDSFGYDLKDHKHQPGEWGSYDTFFNYHMAVKRLGELEDMIESIPADRLQEIIQAEKDGRLVTLPCRVGDIVDFDKSGINKVTGIDITAHYECGKDGTCGQVIYSTENPEWNISSEAALKEAKE